MVTLQVNDQTITAPEGQSLLEACLAHDIYIPNLCHIPDLERPQASCRLCLVEVEGQPSPVTACTVRVTEGLRARTATQEVRELQRSALRLLLSVHDIDCKNCPANRNCPLQDLARHLQMALKADPLETYLKEPASDHSHPRIDYLQNRCVLCGRCIHTCGASGASPKLAFAQRGFDTVIRYFGLAPEINSTCQGCHSCIDACPVAALQLRE